MAGFDDIIDVRAPSEFGDDHLPGAINLPVLSDAERARVGTIYKQVSPFDARKIGASLVAANAARHIAGPLADRPGGWRPLVYCWRGGQRSGSFASILSQIGWRVMRLEGGYKSWRRLVTQRLEAQGIDAPVIVIDGNTGSAKTAILQRLKTRGWQVIDLEGLAHHRGSLFGAVGDQPSQKLFEGRLAAGIEGLDPARPVLIEAESSKIGARILPRAVWQAICAAPRLRLVAPLAARARFCVDDYADIACDHDRIEAVLTKLAPMHPADRISDWQALLSAGDLYNLAAGLMSQHYDPRYEKHRTRYDANECGVVRLSGLDDLDAAAAQVEAGLVKLKPAQKDAPVI